MVEGHKLTPMKAKMMLKDKTVRGHKLTSKQMRFFGLIAGKKSYLVRKNG